jgi:CheY-like chemotaxis protein
VRLTVTDTGTGMAAEVKQRAFEPFFTTKQPGKGTGLGLSTIYGFVQQLGGSIGLYSEVNRGTSISIYLPRAETTEADETRRQKVVQPPLAAGETILVVEDNPEVRLVTRSRLEQLGYKVLEAETGPAAIEALTSNQRINVVFSDVVLGGGMSGFDVARWVNQNKPGLKIVMTSGYPDQVLSSQDATAAALKMLRKPYNLRELAECLRSSLAS